MYTASTSRIWLILAPVRARDAGWKTDMTRSRRVTDRRQFRLWTEPDKTTGFLAVALFCDVPVGAASGEAVPCTPTMKQVQTVIKQATGDAGYGETTGATGPLRLAVLLLHSDASARPSAMVERLLRSLATAGGGQFWVEMWHVRDLQFNVLEHCDVPRHTRLSAADIAQLPRTLRPEQLPIMLTKDPVARAMHLVEGDVIRIDRDDSRFGRSVVYRWVQEIARPPPVWAGQQRPQ